MRITFINNNGNDELRVQGLQAVNNRVKDFEFYMLFEAPHAENDEEEFIDLLADYKNEINTIEDLERIIEQWKELPPFNEYGLSWDYVELGTFTDQTGDYFRYQLSFGGPSEEIRFHPDGNIEFVYLDWFCGVGFDISNEDWAVWLKETLEDIEMIAFEKEREKTDYYIKKAEIDGELDEDEEDDIE